MSKVTVCNFKKYDIKNDKYVQFLDKRKRTIEAIKNLGNGYSPISETCIEVDPSEIDINGYYPKK